MQLVPIRVAGGRFVSRGMGIGNSSKPHLYQTGKLHGNLTREFDQGRAELSHGTFLLDPGIFAWVEQASDTGENCSTPRSRPRIRPGRFCLGRIPGLRPGVEQVSGRMGGWLDRGINAPVEIPPDPRILAGGGRP